MKITQKCKVVNKRFVEWPNKIQYFIHIESDGAFSFCEFQILERDYLKINIGDELDLTLSNGKK